MTTPIDALISPTLKHLREHWWDDEFTEFLAETLRPRSGNRILDVGCGEGLAEVSIGRLHISQIRLVGIDRELSKVVAAKRETASHNQRARFAAADACQLPFAGAAFDSLFCVAVLQHIGDVDAAVAECARVTVSGGKVVAVEPDNSARYAFSSVPSGSRAFPSWRQRVANRPTRPSDRSCRSCSLAMESIRSACGCSRCPTRSLEHRQPPSGSSDAGRSNARSNTHRAKGCASSERSIWSS
jgi:SAM-dependent methyltransferase